MNDEPTTPALCMESAAAPNVAPLGMMTLIGVPLGAAQEIQRRAEIQRRREAQNNDKRKSWH